MSKNRSLLGVIGVIAAAVIIYFGFFYPQPDGDGLSATIGTVAKHQNEQITDEDVVLAGEETTVWSEDPVVVEAMASILERATIAQRSFAYLAVGRKARTDLLLGANPEIQSAVLRQVARAEQVVAFKRVQKDDQKPMYGRMGLKEADFRAMSVEKQVAALGSLSVEDRANILRRASVAIQMEAVAKADPKTHSAILERASRHDLARAYVAAPALSRRDMFNSLPLNERQALMGKVYANSGNNMLQRATPVEMEHMRNQMTDQAAADLYGASSVHDQLVWAGRAVSTSPTSFELGRVQNQNTMGRLYLQATPEQKVAFFRAQPMDVQNDIHGKMSINRDTWEGMDLNAKAKALSGLSLERQAAMLARVNNATVVGLARQADPAIQKEFVAGLSKTDRAEALRLGASSREVQQALSRHPEIRNVVFGQVSTEVQIRFMERMIQTNSPDQ